MVNKENKLISIIIPVFNRSKIISNTIDSILAQKYLFWECVIVDDFSTDNLSVVLQPLLRADTRFKLVMNDRTKGASGARNTGLKHARGELIMFLDSDDLLLSHCLKKRVENFKENPALDFVISFQKRLVGGVETHYVNIPTKDLELLRFYSLHPPQDIPWVNNMLLIRHGFLKERDIIWDEEILKYQDIQFHLDLLIHEPVYKWAMHDADCYWVFDKNEKNIGSDSEIKEIIKVEKILRIYNKGILKFKGENRIRQQLIQQYNSQVLYFTFQAMKDNIEFENFLFSIKNISGFSWLDISLLRLCSYISSFKKRYYIHRFIAKKAKSYLEKKYAPVIKEGYFLKIKTLPFSL